MVQQLDMQGAITRFYDMQGNAERIKQYPLPRKYATFSFVFICIFILLLPFGIIGEFSKLGSVGTWLTVPVGAIVGWVYVVMEMVGDYSENPFEGLHNDVPMLSMCRTIEIDLLQLLEEQDIPDVIGSKGNTLL
jgi:putative membrane protein